MLRRDFAPHPRRSHDRPHAGASGSYQTRTGRCIALVDAAFLAWLVGQNATGESALRRRALVPVLSAALAQAGLEVDLRRIYWYTDRPDNAWIDDQVTRGVLSEDADGGASLLRSIGSDLARLSQNRAVDHLLLVSDDERLLGGIDDAQLCGVAVHVLADDRAGDGERVGRDDPGWATLLAHADRRVPLAGSLMADLVQDRGTGADGGPAGAADESRLRSEIDTLVRSWWDEEPEQQREDLRDELRMSRGIPAEVDRVLLLRMRRTLGRALSWPEKRLMRELARAVVLGATEAPAAPEPGGNSEDAQTG